MAAKLSGSGGGRYDLAQNSEINVTPFVDVMLVLLIIFMVAAPLATVSVKVDLPPAVAPQSPNPPTPVFLSIQRSGRVFIGDFPTDLDSLGDKIHEVASGRDPTKERIFIRGDGDVQYQDFMRVLNKLQDNGFYSVALVGNDVNGGAKK
ncbi:MAG TPA: biopolymer transporter ExbD [Caulobacteraceae bacterium]|nr:biopolymer transporter ExbD [Caulobacteraceae bacterium]